MVETSNRKPERDLVVVVLFLIVLGVLWYAMGGSSRPQPQGLFLENTYQPVSTFDNNEHVASDSVSLPESKESFFLYSSQAVSVNSQTEYIEISLSFNSQQSFDITNWKLEGKKRKVIIPQAVPLYLANRVNLQENIVLKPGDKAIFLTGKSPLGVSFRLNKCSGYFEQSQVFYPRLLEQCPYPKDENWSDDLSDECFDYIDILPRCRANFTHPFHLKSNCIEAINKTLSYNKCVELHKDDNDFYKNEWRIYLGRSEELWKNSHETIILYDKNGNLVEQVSY